MNKEVQITDEQSLKNKEWYQRMIEECKAIIVETRHNANIELIKGKWELGRRIYKENERMERTEIYGDKVIESISNDVGMSQSTLWQAVQFYKENRVDENGNEYVGFDGMLAEQPWGKDITWTKIINKYLGEPDDNEETEDDEADDTSLDQTRTFNINDILEVFKVYCMEEFDLGLNDEGLQEKVTHFKNMLQEMKGS